MEGQVEERKDELKDGQTLFYRTLSATDKGRERGSNSPSIFPLPKAMKTEQ